MRIASERPITSKLKEWLHELTLKSNCSAMSRDTCWVGGRVISNSTSLRYCSKLKNDGSGSENWGSGAGGSGGGFGSPNSESEILFNHPIRMGGGISTSGTGNGTGRWPRNGSNSGSG